MAFEIVGLRKLKIQFFSLVGGKSLQNWIYVRYKFPPDSNILK